MSIVDDFVVAQTYTVFDCDHDGCGVHYALDDDYVARRRADGKSWQCPNGHSRIFLGKTEAQKAAERAEAAEARARRLERQLANRDEDVRSARASLAATKGVLTKTRKRIGNGVCPCCNRHFANVEHHMLRQHPEYATTGG